LVKKGQLNETPLMGIFQRKSSNPRNPQKEAFSKEEKGTWK